MTDDMFEIRVREICTQMVHDYADKDNQTQSHIDSFCDWVMINYTKDEIEELDEDDYELFIEDSYEELIDDDLYDSLIDDPDDEW
jgi:hypothetical protein